VNVSLYAGWELENREKRALRGAIKGNLERQEGLYLSSKPHSKLCHFRTGPNA
jgi:hypothetical protein